MDENRNTTPKRRGRDRGQLHALPLPAPTSMAEAAGEQAALIDRELQRCVVRSLVVRQTRMLLIKRALMDLDASLPSGVATPEELVEDVASLHVLRETVHAMMLRGCEYIARVERRGKSAPRETPPEA
jgi:hypothetical protein